MVGAPGQEGLDDSEVVAPFCSFEELFLGEFREGALECEVGSERPGYVGVSSLSQGLLFGVEIER